MASQLDRWEKDPFFPAAEEVQESADRMESTYRTLVHALKEPSAWKTEELRRDLRTALGTTKWQLEEFERAVMSSYNQKCTDDAKARHGEFISAMESQISKVESSLKESAVKIGKPPRPWVRLDEGESKELALFLSGSPSYGDAEPANIHFNDDQTRGQNEDVLEQSIPECSKSLSPPVQWGSVEAKEEKFSGHRRTASASADIGSWNIAVADDVSRHSVDVKPEKPPRKIPSFSGFLNTMESASKFKWPKNGYRKLKLTDHHNDADTKLPETQPLTRGINVCYEKSKSCLDSGSDCYNKQLYGWHGAIQRQFQRSQYYMQYSRRTQMVFWILILLCLVALVAIRAI